jgi:hypothetical protein
MNAKTRALIRHSAPLPSPAPISAGSVVELSIDELLDQLERHGVRFIRVAADEAHDIQLVSGKTQLLAALHRRSR